MRRRPTAIGISALILMTTLVAPAALRPIPAQAAPTMAYNIINSGLVSEFLVPLTAGRRVTFETRNLSPNSDPVLHLLSLSGTQVAVDDNGAGGTAARLSYTPFHTDSYRVIPICSRTGPCSLAPSRSLGSVCTCPA